ncbi:hypothetical protein K7432_007452 [Basidiobolus ranarum]|uniref:Uncharacterized protein n=1 Tax=Basidiobolus ranarum TaxID=34480 RepID=A0ABR2W021_9FUNG
MGEGQAVRQAVVEEQFGSHSGHKTLHTAVYAGQPMLLSWYCGQQSKDALLE